MSDVVVLCPTRERPERAAEMVGSLRQTATRLSTEVILVVDDDDPTVAQYMDLPGRFNHQSPGPLWPPDAVRVMVLRPAQTGSLTAATNSAAARIWNDDCIIGHVGDDHRFLTVGWDSRISDTLARPGVAYGDDGYWHAVLPTAAFLSSVIPRTLGWYALPIVRHYGIDDAWGDLGRGIDSFHYLEDVKIFQPGPEETRAAGDEVFWRAQVTRDQDATTYFAWRDGEGRLEAVRTLREAGL